MQLQCNTYLTIRFTRALLFIGTKEIRQRRWTAHQGRSVLHAPAVLRSEVASKVQHYTR